MRLVRLILLAVITIMVIGSTISIASNTGAFEKLLLLALIALLIAAASKVRRLGTAQQ